MFDLIKQLYKHSLYFKSYYKQNNFKILINSPYNFFFISFLIFAFPPFKYLTNVLKSGSTRLYLKYILVCNVPLGVGSHTVFVFVFHKLPQMNFLVQTMLGKYWFRQFYIYCLKEVIWQYGNKKNNLESLFLCFASLHILKGILKI